MTIKKICPMVFTMPIFSEKLQQAADLRRFLPRITRAWFKWVTLDPWHHRCKLYIPFYLGMKMISSCTTVHFYAFKDNKSWRGGTGFLCSTIKSIFGVRWKLEWLQGWWLGLPGLSLLPPQQSNCRGHQCSTLHRPSHCTSLWSRCYRWLLVAWCSPASCHSPWRHSSGGHL